MQKHFVSERRACLIIGIARSTKRYPALFSEEDERISERLAIHAARWKGFGYRRLQVLLEREGIIVNHKKVYRLYKEAGLGLKKQRKKKAYMLRGKSVSLEAAMPNVRWSMDFVSDKTSTFSVPRASLACASTWHTLTSTRTDRLGMRQPSWFCV